MNRKHMAAIILILAVSGVWVVRPAVSNFAVGLSFGTWYSGWPHMLHRFEVPANTEVRIAFTQPWFVCPSKGRVAAEIYTGSDTFDTVPTVKNPCRQEFLYSRRTRTHLVVRVRNYQEYYPLMYTISVVPIRRVNPPPPTATPFYPVIIPAHSGPGPVAP